MLPSTLDHKDHEISVADQLMMPTRRLINPCKVTPATVSTPISMPAIASRTVVPSDIRQNSNADRCTTTNTATPSASDHSPLSSQRDLAPSQQGVSCTWLVGFKVFGFDPYDGKANPEKWMQLYEIDVRAA